MKGLRWEVMTGRWGRSSCARVPRYRPSALLSEGPVGWALGVGGDGVTVGVQRKREEARTQVIVELRRW